MARILFVYPPTADPTGPYLSIPYLAAAVRSRGHHSGVVDVNLAAYRELLRRDTLEGFGEHCRERLRRLGSEPLRFESASEYLALALAAHDADAVAAGVEDALAVLKDERRFYVQAEYERAFQVLERALALISARHHPLELSFTAYRTPCYLNDAAEILRDSDPRRNPFDAPIRNHLLPAIERERPDVVAISATFNAQLQQTFAIGRLVKELYPGIHVIAGGTAITQLYLRCERDAVAELAPFVDSLGLFEGERLLTDLLDRIDARSSLSELQNLVLLAEPPSSWITRATAESLDAWPTPDYDGFPLDQYFSPALMLYVAPTRGCYWEKCAFCHYGLTDTGTAPYRRRSADAFVDDLEAMQQRYGARYFYFAGDLIDPKLLFQLSERIVARKLDVRFTSDLRIERSFTRERCLLLKQAGLVAAAFGTESDSPRLLALMDKGTDPSANRQVFEHFAGAGIAVQAMTFIDFPTETAAEAHATLDLLEQNQDRIDLFFVEEFDLEAGSRVFKTPDQYGVKEIWYPRGDRYRLRARMELRAEAKRPDDYRSIVSRLDRLASAYGRRPYPYAGSVSVAHTMMWFDRHGRTVFKKQRTEPAPGGPGGRAARRESWLDRAPRLAERIALADLPFDLQELAEHVGDAAGRITADRERGMRDVRRSTYEALSAAVPALPPAESYYVLPELGAPVAIPEWLWRLLSCLDGTFTVREAARAVRVPPRQADEAVAALVERGFLVEPAPEQQPGVAAERS